MASVVDVCNRALSRLGAGRITSLTDNTKSAKACNSAWPLMRDEVLALHPWNGAGSRAVLAELAASPSPDFDYENQFQWPADCLRVLEVDTDYTWTCEGRKIMTDGAAPLEIRYIKRETDPNQYGPLLISVLAARMAVEMVEELTQSNTKKEAMEKWYATALRVARSANAQEQSPMEFQEDSWINARN